MKPVLSKNYMVVTANPLATKAGCDVLKAGGSAADAAVAVQMVLGLVEPQSSGIGGGAFVVHYDAASKTVQTYDGRETAPRCRDRRLPALYQRYRANFATAQRPAQRPCDRHARHGACAGSAPQRPWGQAMGWAV
jgi:gamma-glutamyltranspeptidase